MASGPSIRYNIEPRVETLYSAPDYELRLLSAFDLATTFLVIVMGELATVATTLALRASAGITYQFGEGEMV